MIPNNSTLQIKRKGLGGGGLDDDGNPVPVQGGWSDPIECRIVTLSHSETGKYEDGKFVQSSYMVFIDGTDEIEADRVRLNRQGVYLGEFNVQSNEYLRLVNRVKIRV